MIYQAIGIGIVVSFAFYEIVGLSPGGIVVPGYIALFLAMILIGFLLKWLVEEIIITMPISGIELRGIGYIIPGLIANEMRRQGIFPTIYSLAIVSIFVRLILLLFLKS